jgi:iron complex outermembrane receptor protein
MDADYDDSEIVNAEYVIKNISDYSKELNIQAYQSTVDHPMSTAKRAGMLMINDLSTKMQGFKVKNRFDIDKTSVKVGLDASNRSWNGRYSNGIVSIADADTENRALFAEVSQRYDALKVKVGARYDDTSIKSADATFQSNDYNTLSANIYATYDMGTSTNIFGGFGKSSRVPDARELYFRSSMGGTHVGTDNLKETTNYEIDLGIEQKYEMADVKLTTFYSQLKDYIYHFTAMGANQFTNIDATVYGLELSASYYPLDMISVDFGVAYQKGKKDDLPTGHTDDDLADIPPLKGMMSFNYHYGDENYARLEMVAADRWDNFDSNVAEQEIAGYSIVNFKVSHDVSNTFNLTAGVDNILDKNYAVSNTYNDLTLLTAGSGDIMLLNEPGRYVYVNATYKF